MAKEAGIYNLEGIGRLLAASLCCKHWDNTIGISGPKAEVKALGAIKSWMKKEKYGLKGEVLKQRKKLQNLTTDKLFIKTC